MRDHPRIRGNSIQSALESDGAVGSPPHTREQLEVDERRFIVFGITPAYAGTAGFSRPVFCRQRDHPRIRGNSPLGRFEKQAAAGSPPHTREQPVTDSNDTIGWRITPAYAGTADRFLSAAGRWRDHPRIRGNSYTSGSSVLKHPGSPPHTREQQTAQKIGRDWMRITPAYAGTAPSAHSVG